MARPGVGQAEALMKRFGLSPADLLGLRFAINVALATIIVWFVLRALNVGNPVWAIASMIAASEPQPEEARRMLRARLVNVGVGSAAGFLFLFIAGPRGWILPLALAATVLVSSYVVRVKTMWRQAPITAAMVIASAVASESLTLGITQGLRKVAEVVFGSLVGVIVSLVMSRVWLIRGSPSAGG
jgi:uncharacterized membrane protein YccC